MISAYALAHPSARAFCQKGHKVHVQSGAALGDILFINALGESDALMIIGGKICVLLGKIGSFKIHIALCLTTSCKFA